MERSFGVPPHPALRPVHTRSTVRVLLIDDRDRLLLFQDSDPGIDAVWWILPGGGIDPGESDLEAVVREIAEETGYVVRPDTVLGPLARRRVLHGYSDQVVHQDDAFFAIVVERFEISTAGHTEEEQRTLQQHRWWSRDELADTGEEIWPVLLPELWELVGQPGAWPVALDPVEESSVAVGDLDQPRSSPG